MIRYQNVWLSTEEKLQARSKRVFEDRGVLLIYPSHLEFQSKSQALSISGVNNATAYHFKPTRFTSTIYTILLLGIFIACVLTLIELLLYYLVYDLSFPLNFSIPVWVGFLILFTLVISALIFNFSSSGPLGSSMWVKIDYLNEQNQLQTVYLAESSWFGWGGILGGTKKMHETIHRELLERNAANKESFSKI